MIGHSRFSAALPLFAAPILVACMTNPVAASCSVQGAQVLGAEESEICSRFQQRLSAALDDRMVAEGLSVSLNAQKSGTIEAVIVTSSTNGTKTYPGVSVDVMDRSLNLSDVDMLARAAADVMLKEQTADRSAN